MILISLTLIVLQAMSGINSYGTPSGINSNSGAQLLYEPGCPLLT